MEQGAIICGLITYYCKLYGSDEVVILGEKDIPLVVMEEFKKFGSLQNHQEVSCCFEI
jgi:predicted RNase H-like nuclease